MPETQRDDRGPRDETLFPLLTVNEAAARMGISRATLYRLMKNEQIKYAQPEGHARKIPVSEIRRYADSLLESAGVGAAA